MHSDLETGRPQLQLPGDTTNLGSGSSAGVGYDADPHAAGAGAGGGGGAAAVAAAAAALQSPENDLRTRFGTIIETGNKPSSSCCRVLEPDEPFRVGWDAVMVAVLLLITLVVPFQISFAVDVADFSLHWWAWTAVDIFFWIDILLNFNTGFVVDIDGSTEMRRPQIRCSYLKGWFIFDIIGCLPLRYFVDNSRSSGDHNKMVRMLRLAKLARLARFRTTLRSHAEKLYSLKKLGKVAAAVLMMLLLSHLVACFWFWIGTLGEDGAIGAPGGWIEAAGINQTASSIEKYQIALYWSITTLSTVGYGDISPQLPAERTVSCVVSIFGVLLLAVLMGYLGDAVAAAPLLEKDSQERMDRLLEYLREQVPDPQLRREVRGVLEAQLRDQAYDGSIYLDLLPMRLRERVLAHIHRRSAHVFLSKSAPNDHQRQWGCEKQHYIDKLLDKSRRDICPAGATIYEKGDPAFEFFFVVSGEVELSIDNYEGFKRVISHQDGCFFGEREMFYSRRFTTLRAASERLFERLDTNQDGRLCPNEFQRLVQEDKEMKDLLAEADVNIETLFGMLDANCDGKISLDEFTQVLTRAEPHGSLPFTGRRRHQTACVSAKGPAEVRYMSWKELSDLCTSSRIGEEIFKMIEAGAKAKVDKDNEWAQKINEETNQPNATISWKRLPIYETLQRGTAAPAASGANSFRLRRDTPPTEIMRPAVEAAAAAMQGCQTRSSPRDGSAGAPTSMEANMDAFMAALQQQQTERREVSSTLCEIVKLQKEMQRQLQLLQMKQPETGTEAAVPGIQHHRSLDRSSSSERELVPRTATTLSPSSSGNSRRSARVGV